MSYNKESQKAYNEKCTVVRLKYTEKEMEEYNRLIAYIEQTNQLKSVYIKELIKKDLESKGLLP